MIYIPEKICPELLLALCGFTDKDCSRGYILPRKRGGSKGARPQANVNRIHALILFPDREIECHEDAVSGNKHLCRKHSQRLQNFKNLLRLWDTMNEDIPLDTVKSFYEKYDAKLPESYKKKHKLP